MDGLPIALALFVASGIPSPTGRLVPVGDHQIHIDCRGRGLPAVVVESGLGEFTSDWRSVQEIVAGDTRICTYDRAGYAWSTPGPLPRTFDQINLELREALKNAGERGPFVLVGHSFGGPVVRNFAERYPSEVAGMVLVDSVHENQQVFVAGKWIRLRGSAIGREIPEARLGSAVAMRPSLESGAIAAALQTAEDSQRDWSAEYFERWHNHPQTALLNSKPLIVLARGADDLTNESATASRERVALQVSQRALSTDSLVIFAGLDHDMQRTIPDVVAACILQVVRAVRLHRPVSRLGLNATSSSSH